MWSRKSAMLGSLAVAMYLLGLTLRNSQLVTIAVVIFVIGPTRVRRTIFGDRGAQALPQRNPSLILPNEVHHNRLLLLHFHSRSIDVIDGGVSLTLLVELVLVLLDSGHSTCVGLGFDDGGGRG